MSLRFATALALALALLALVPGGALAGKGEFVVVASGKTDGTRWMFGVVGGNGERCYSSITRDRPVGGEFWESNGEVCEAASAPRGEWSHVLGHDVGDEGVVELQQTSARVHSLELLLRDPFGGKAYEPEWRRVRTRALSSSERAKTKLGPGYRFAAVASPRPFCITAVRTFDRDGELLRERKVPCEY